MTKSKKYAVVGPHRVAGVNPGEEISLDPSEPQTVRLLARGQISPASSRSEVTSVEETSERKSESKTDPSPS